MPVARLSFSGYQSSNENGGGNHPWQNVQGAGATAFGAGAYDSRDPNSADMNWIRSQGDGARGSASIPAGSIVTGIIVGFEAKQTGGAQTGGTCICSIFKAGSQVASKSVSLPQGGSVGPFGATNDLWGLGASATPTYFTNMYFGLHLNFPTITADISMFAWNGYMDIYYNDPVPVPASISAAAGNNQSAQVSTQFTNQLYAIVTDQGGNPMAGKSVTFTMPASGATARFNSVGGSATATAITNAAGGAVSPFFFANATAGSYQPVADVTGTSPLIYTLFNMTNTPVPPVLVPTTISRLQGDGQQTAVGTAFAVVQKVKVFDQFVHTMSNVEITWPTPGSGASGSYAGGTPAHSFTDVNGVATAPVLTANLTAGAWTENAFPTGFAAVIAPFGFTNLANNSPPTPTVLQAYQGATGQSAALNTQFPLALQMKVLDQYGSPMNGVTISATIPSSSNGQFNNTTQAQTAVTGSSGGDFIARWGNVVAGPVANAGWFITMTCPGTAGFSPGPWKNIDATLATGMSGVSGGNQIATPSTAFAQPLRVRVTNGLGNGIQNYGVTFTAPGSAASCTFSGGASPLLVLTDVNGYAQVSPTANATEGSYNVTASASGLTSITFALQNGNTYGTEVCTVFENLPGPNSNQPLFTVGATPASWNNLGNASTAAQGATGAGNTQQPPNTNVSNAMYLYPPPATWAAVPNDARITSISLNFSARIPIVSAQNGTGTMIINLLKGGVGFASLANGSVAAADTWFNFSRTVTPTTANPISGAELKANCGFTINFAPASNLGPNQGVLVNGCQVKVCWRPLIPPPVHAGMPPLMACEA